MPGARRQCCPSRPEQRRPRARRPGCATRRAGDERRGFSRAASGPSLPHDESKHALPKRVRIQKLRPFQYGRPELTRWRGEPVTDPTAHPEEGLNPTKLFLEHYDGLFRYLVRLTGDPDLAADAAQEAFVRLVERPPQDRHVRAWLYAVATNVVRDTARSRSRWLVLLKASPDRAPVADAGPLPDEAAEGAERRRVVREALDRMSWKERTVLLMREEGFAHHEIADAVGTTTGSVGTMIARALRKLSTELSPQTESLK
jgi:RNA polymerase sigma-70 factor, ECF subfamily